MYKAFIIPFGFLYFIVLRWFRLNDCLFFDYDAVKNFTIAQEISEGNFASLFHHGSPLLHLFHGFSYLLIKQYTLYLPAIFESMGILIILHTLFIKYDKTSNSFWTTSTIVLTGTSFLLVNTGRYFSLEPYTVFVFALWFSHYNNNTHTHFWLMGLLLFINYKMCILIPFCILNDFFLKKERANIKSIYYYIIPAWIIPASMLMAYLVNQNIFTYLKNTLAMLFLRDETTIHPHGTINLSIDFYLQYLLFFEHPIILIGLISSIVYCTTNFVKKESLSIAHTIPVFITTLMILLPPAPRGIVITIPFLCFSGMLLIDYIIHKYQSYSTLIYLTCILSSSYPIYILIDNVYLKSSSGYIHIADFIKKENIQHIYTTSGIGIQPYLSKQTTVKAIEREEQCAKIPSGSYILIDAEALINGWNKLPSGTCLSSSSNTCKTQIMLALENAEYSGLSYQEIREANKKISLLEDKQLCIIKKGY